MTSYLAGETSFAVRLELAQLSADLGKWSLVKKLTEELAREAPGNAGAQALYRKAVSATEKKP